MVDIVTYINTTWLSLKPFDVNFFKSSVIISCVVLGIWLLTSKVTVNRLLDFVDRVDNIDPSQLRKVAWLMGFIFASFLIYLRIRQYYELQTMWDMAVEANVAWHMVHGPWFFNSLDQSSFLGGHFSPILILIGYVYRFAEHPLTLLIIQSVALGLGAVAVYYLALSIRLRPSLGFVTLLLYVSNPYLHHSNAHDFHLSPLAIPTVLWMLVFIESGKQGLACAAVLVAFSIEESILLPLAGYGIYLTVFRPDRRLFGTLLTTSALIFFALIVTVIFPMFSPYPALFFWHRYANLGTDLKDALLHVVSNPLWAGYEAFFSRNQYLYLMYFLAPVAFLPLLAWREASLLVIPLTIMFLSQNSGMNKLGFHYSVPALPFLFFSVMHGLNKAARFLDPLWKPTSSRWATVFGGLLLLLALNTYRSPGYDIGKTNPEFAASAFEITSLVPLEASVATDVRLAPLLINRHRICKISMIEGTLCDWTLVDGTPDIKERDKRVLPAWVPEYVVLVVEPGKASDLQVKKQREFARWLMTTQSYREIRNQNGIILFHYSELATKEIREAS